MLRVRRSASVLEMCLSVKGRDGGSHSGGAATETWMGAELVEKGVARGSRARNKDKV